MTIHRHIDFEVPDWAEVDAGPQTRRGYIDEVLADGPVSFWRFDETIGAVAADLVANRDLTLSGGYMRDQAGPLAFDDSPATSFDGTDAQADSLDSSLLSQRDACTITFWLRFDGAAVVEDHAVLSSWRAGDNGLLVWVDQYAAHSGSYRTLSFAVATNTGGAAVGRVEGPTDLIRPGQWDFYACVFDGGSSLAIYRGSAGEPLTLASSVSGVVSATPDLSQPILVGSTSSPASIGHLPGALANLAVYHDALSVERLEAHLNAGVGRWA